MANKYTITTNTWIDKGNTDNEDTILNMELKINDNLKKLLNSVVVIDDEERADTNTFFDTYHSKRKLIKSTIRNSNEWVNELNLLFDNDLLEKGIIEFKINSLETARKISDNLRNNSKPIIQKIAQLKNLEKPIKKEIILIEADR